MKFCLCLVFFLILFRVNNNAAENNPASGRNNLSQKIIPQQIQKKREILPQGKHVKRLALAKVGKKTASPYRKWKKNLPFWQGKILTFTELGLIICFGILLGQMLEVSGLMRPISIITWPLLKLGRLPQTVAPALIMSFQSGAIANSMLVSARDEGSLNQRELYTSVLIVSCFTLFAHLPAVVMPLGMAFGWQATAALFGVRLAAIGFQIITTLIVSSLLVSRFTDKVKVDRQIKKKNGKKKIAEVNSFWQKVWRRSRKTLFRLLGYLLPTFLLMSTLEYYHFFAWLAEQIPGIFSLSFLPPESAAIIPAQAVSMYNGAIAAANFVDAEAISLKQAIIVILLGSIVTAPLRTLRHAMPTYLAVLGARPGFIMAISAQLLRMMFLLVCTIVLMLYWGLYG